MSIWQASKFRQCTSANMKFICGVLLLALLVADSNSAPVEELTAIKEPTDENVAPIEATEASDSAPKNIMKRSFYGGYGGYGGYGLGYGYGYGGYGYGLGHGYYGHGYYPYYGHSYGYYWPHSYYGVGHYGGWW